jgi:hypothetical protein
MTQKHFTDIHQLADALQKSGCGWILQFEDRDITLQIVAEALNEFIEKYIKRFSDTPDPFRLLENNPAKGKAFFQVLSGAHVSSDMLLAIWRIFEGAEIHSINFEYQRTEKFGLRIILKMPYDEIMEEYKSNELRDFRILRHLGTLTIDGTPVLEGFYALNLQK